MGCSASSEISSEFKSIPLAAPLHPISSPFPLFSVLTRGVREVVNHDRYRTLVHHPLEEAQDRLTVTSHGESKVPRADDDSVGSSVCGGVAAVFDGQLK